jgi:predicted nuclease of predicted toxin-antitoxin system
MHPAIINVLQLRIGKISTRILKKLMLMVLGIISKDTKRQNHVVSGVSLDPPSK